MKRVFFSIIAFASWMISCTSPSGTQVNSSVVTPDTISIEDSINDRRMTELPTDTLSTKTELDEAVADSVKPIVKRPPVKVGALLVPDYKVRGIYVTGPTAGTKRMKSMIELITSTSSLPHGLNAMVLDVKNDGGNITYKMQDTLAKSVGACIGYVRDMPALIRELHENGIYVIGRIVCFKDPYLAKYRRDLALLKADSSAVTDGKGLPWVNPYKRDVWDYICRLAEQASKDGFDEIQFDYVRFPITDNKKNPPQYGVDLDSFPREQCLSEFFAYCQKRLHAKNIIFGADLFGTVIGSPTDRDLTGQNYTQLGIMADNVCPMIYPSHYNKNTFGIPVPDANPYLTIYKALELSKEQLSRKDSMRTCAVRPWLQCFTASWVQGYISYGSKQLREQIQAVYDAGYDEWILWNASNRYDYVKAALLPASKSTKSEEPAKTDSLKSDSLIDKKQSATSEQ